MHKMSTQTQLQELHEEVIACTRCPRLVEWRERVARERVRRFADQVYWGKAIPGFGDPAARLLILGLAPAAHGANRTGRMFTGDRSGDWLYRSLYKFGFASQSKSTAQDDGLVLTDCYITAALHCAPPQNKPTAEEKNNCLPYLIQEIQILQNVQTIVVLGKIAFDTAVRILRQLNKLDREAKLNFSHGGEFCLPDGLTLLASFHPSQQNTFTGRLTEPMFDAVFERARQLIERNERSLNPTETKTR